MSVVPLNILFVQSTSEIGGADVSLLRIVEKLDKARFRPFVALPCDGPLVQSYRRAGCEVHLVPQMLQLTSRRGIGYLLRYAINYPRGVLALCRKIRELHADVVHTNSIHNLYGFWAARRTGRPHVWHVREIVTQGRALLALERFLARRYADVLVSVSDAASVQFLYRSGRPPAALKTIPDSIDLGEFSADRDGRRMREELEIPADAPVAAAVGRLDRRKGFEAFLRVAAHCADRLPRARFLVVGGSIAGQEAYAEELHALADSLGLASRVRFCGWRYGPERVAELFSAIDVLVHLSPEPESFGLAALEAMASGKPVLTTRLGGIAEVCSEGAVFVKNDRPEAAAEELLGLLRDPQRRKTLGASGRRRAELFYDCARWIRTLESLYEKLARQGRGK